MIFLVPQPNRLHYLAGTFRLPQTLGVPLTIFSAPFWDDFAQFALRIRGLRLKAGTDLQIDLRSDLQPEAYVLRITEHEIRISAAGKQGVFYALQTLKQILLQSTAALPALLVEDAPRFSYRGFMLDVGRYFYPVAEIKRYLDLMAVHKLNRFHWHLTEDQGWRIEMQAFPLLTQKGSKRSHTNFGLKSHGGYYTQDEVRDIVAYAKARCIQVIPEFDIPGHTVAAIACYPELSCFHRKLRVATHWGVKHDILCAGKEATYAFVYKVLDELMALFPDGMIHIGGDEADKTRWNLCPDCNRAMTQQQLANMDELQQRFMSNVGQYLRKRGVQPCMWGWAEQTAPKHLAQDLTWYYYHTEEKSTAMVAMQLQQGRDIVNTAAFPYYLDFPYSWNNLQRVYEYDPSGIQNEPGKGKLLGVEAALWTEYVPGRNRADFLTFPRLGAIAEAAWSKQENRSWTLFQQKLPSYYALLDAFQVRYAFRKQTAPGKLAGAMQTAWFNRRVLHWQGLHNWLEDTMVKHRHHRTRTQR